MDKIAEVSFPTSPVHMLIRVVHTYAHTCTLLPLCDVQGTGLSMMEGLLWQLGSKGRLSEKVLYLRNLIESKEYPCRYQ